MSELGKGIKLGDLITAYHAGFHRVTAIDRSVKDGEAWHVMIHYVTVLTAQYKKTNTKSVRSCDATYCEKLTKASIAEKRDTLINEIKVGYEILSELAEN